MNPKAPRTTTAAGIGIPVATVLIWAFVQATGIEVPEPVAAAWGSICSFVFALVTVER